MIQLSRLSSKPFFLSAYVLLLYFFLYVPIIIVVFFSFNNSTLPYAWKGFTTNWYVELWHSTEVWNALRNSLIVATASVLLSSVMGVLAVYYSSQTKLARWIAIFYGTLAIPEIVLAAGLLSLFLFLQIPLGYTSLIAAHTVLGLGYVVPMVHTRFSELDYTFTEASLDLGATRTQTFFSVILPLLMPTIISSALLVFIVSLDDFLLSFFCSGASMQTLTMYIFAMIRSGATPLVNALSTILLLVSSIVVMVYSALKIKKMEHDA